MAYSLPTDVATFGEYIAWASAQANDVPIRLFLAFIWIVLSTWLYSRTQEVGAILVSTGITLIVAMLFNTMGLIGWMPVAFTLGGLVVLLLIAWGSTQ